MKKIVLLMMMYCGSSLAYAEGEFEGTYLSLKAGASVLKADDFRNKYKFSVLENATQSYEYQNEGAQSTGHDQTSVFTSSIAYGYAFKSLPVRAELEYSFRNKAKFNDLGLWSDTGIQTNAEVKNQSLMANLYYDFKNTSLFTPYISAGLGTSFNKLKVRAIGDSADDYANNRKTDFAWSVGAGVSYHVNTNMDVDLAYRYIDLGKIEAKHLYHAIGTDYTFSEISQYDSKLKSNDITVGLRYKF